MKLKKNLYLHLIFYYEYFYQGFAIKVEIIVIHNISIILIIALTLRTYS